MPDAASVAARWMREAESIAVLTGAGVSAESGIPTFRGPGGLWRSYRAEDLATPEAFARDPDLVWEWYRFRQKAVAKARPNAGHEALARLETCARRFTLITQNVDGLHRRAGSRAVVELHGSILRARCPADGSAHALTGEEPEDLRCACGRLMRPDVVWFGEPLPEKAVAEAERASREAGLFLVVGTSAVVYPAASFPLLARSSGGRVIEVNVEETPLTSVADLSIRGAAAEVLPRLVEEAFPAVREGR